jgi:transposase-like protein
MCEDCGAAVCSECLETKSTDYIVCGNCHAALGTPSPEEEFTECPECGSTDLTEGKRTVDICPSCHSTRVVLLEERRRNLALSMRHAVMTIQYGHTRLREYNHRLTAAKRHLVSLRMANFLHYKWLEEKLEAAEEEFPAIKNRISSQAEIVAKRMAAETKNLIDYTMWSTSQFPFIEGVINRITEIGNYYKQNVDEALEPLRAAVKEVKKQLDGLEYYKNQFTVFYEHGQLAVGELPVCALPEIRVTGSDFLKNEKATGTLFITNRRLVFIAETGLVRKKMESVFDFPLMYLKSVEEDGRFRRRLVLRMKQGDLRISCSEQTMSVLPDYVEIARKFDKYIQTDMQRVRRLEQEETGISDVRLKIEELVYALLSTSTRGYEDGTNPPPSDPYRRRPWIGPSPGRIPYDSGYVTRDEFRERLERNLGRNHRGWPYERDPMLDRNLDALRRDAESINQAVKETVRLLRDGRLVAEDFIRRYKDLMRDSYYNRKEIDRLTRDTRDRYW